MKIHRFSLFFLLLSILLLPAVPLAQMGMGGPGMRGPQDRGDDKDMVIKAGKSGDTDLPAARTDDYLDRPPSFQLFDLHGYMRLRSHYNKRLDLGLHNYPGISSPFPSPLTSYADICSQPNSPARCRHHSFSSTNMRLRLEPVIRPSDAVSIHSTLDFFDNLVLGSTPSGFSYGYGSAPWVAVPGSGGTTGVVQSGTTSNWDAIRIKNLWGRVDLKLADLMFGRMPDHFGMGLFRNNGADTDADYGDSVDRIQIVSEIPMFRLQLALSWDFASQGLTSSALYPERDQGQPWDLDDLDDATRWTFTVMRRDTPNTIARKLALGQSVFNWGATGSFLQQDFGLKTPQASDTIPSLSEPSDPSALAAWLVPRKVMLLSPGLWGFFARGNLTLEAEAGMRYGWITHIKDIPNMEKSGNDMNILGWGGVMKMNYRWSSTVTVGLETGHASGDDQYENNIQRGAVHFTQLPAFPINPRDGWNNLMLFHPSYHVDLIFFRQIMGTVYNATYLKPTFRYVQNQWQFRVDGIASFAHEKVATPGNAYLYGFELDADLSYRSQDGSFLIGLAYGVFYPMDAMQRSADIFGSFSSKANMAHTIQGRVLIKF